MQRVFYFIATLAATLFILQAVFGWHRDRAASLQAERDAAWKIIMEETN